MSFMHTYCKLAKQTFVPKRTFEKCTYNIQLVEHNLRKKHFSIYKCFILFCWNSLKKERHAQKRVCNGPKVGKPPPPRPPRSLVVHAGIFVGCIKGWKAFIFSATNFLVKGSCTKYQVCQKFYCNKFQVLLRKRKLKSVYNSIWTKL